MKKLNPLAFFIFLILNLANTKTIQAQGGGCASESDNPAFNKICNPNPWILAFEDNFNGNQIDVSKWNVRETVIRGFTHVGEVQWLSPDNVITINGSLNSIIINLCKD